MDNFIITHRVLRFWYEGNGHDRDEFSPIEMLQDILKSGLNLLKKWLGLYSSCKLWDENPNNCALGNLNEWQNGSNYCYEVNGFDSAGASPTTTA